jgi:hypothetical protein
VAASDWCATAPVDQNDRAMNVESRDSVSLKPAELDELGQLVHTAGLALPDESIDGQVESFPLIAVANGDNELHGFLFGSLERIGGTPCILWGLGALRRGRTSNQALRSLVAELYRRAAISFPDEDVLVAGRFAHPSTYALLTSLDDVCPRPGYTPTGEERAWGRRLARRFGCDGRYDDRAFRVRRNGTPEPILDGSVVKAGGKKAGEAVSKLDPKKGEALIAFGWAMAESLADGLGSVA